MFPSRLNLSRFIVLGSTAVCLHISSTTNAAAVQINLDERPPFHFTQPDGSIGGVALPTLICALEAVDHTPEIEVTSWKRAQAMVKKGDADAFFAASQNATRDEYATISDTFVPQNWSWYVKDPSLDPMSPATRKSIKTGALYGYNATKYIKAEGANVSSEDADIAALLKQLQNDRIEAVFAPNMIVQAAIAEGNFDMELHEVVEIEKHMGAYFSNAFLEEFPDFMTAFNAALPGCQ